MSEPRHSATPATDQQQVICATAATGSSAFNFQALSTDISFSGGARGHHAASDDTSNQSSATLDAPNLTLADPRVLSSGSSSTQVEVEENSPSRSGLPLAPQSASRLSTVTFPTPNANQLFDWSFPGIVLVPPSGPKDTSTSSMRSVGRGTKRQIAITRKRQRDLTTPHFGLVESRINPPSFFSMHLRRTQILMSVREAPDLPLAFSAVVDKYLKARGSDLPNVKSDILPRLDQYCMENNLAQVEDENGIGNVCAVPEEIAGDIASTLYTNSPVWLHGLDWAREATHGIVHAVAGAYLSIANSYHFFGDSVPPGRSDLFEGLYSVRRSQPSPGPIMVWKFVPAGDPFGGEGDEYYEDDGKLMDIILEIAKGNLEFKWTSCWNFTAPHASCNSKQHYNDFSQVTQTGLEMTEDAPVTLTMLESTGGYSMQGIDVTSTRSSACNSRHTLVRRAGFILQDWYSELVAVDATYGVLFTGNKKIVGVRRRDTQSMYLSKVTDVRQDTSCLKVQAGMMLAALEDIKERSSILRAQRRRDAAPEIPAHLSHELGAFLRRQQEITLRWPSGLSLLTGLDQPYIVPRSSLYHAVVDDKAPVNFDNAEIKIRTSFDRNTFLANLWQPHENWHMGNYLLPNSQTATMILRNYERKPLGIYICGKPTTSGSLNVLATGKSRQSLVAFLISECCYWRCAIGLWRHNRHWACHLLYIAADFLFVIFTILL
ncbi:hypothetical protein CPB85DRAFT_1308223 [Mucidula mucida]|nr:hypothetical protein CPB85DRAFT_1308223 [Mucidula mucida]